MKITIPLVSRNRPTGLLSVLTSLDALATGSHHINYVLVVDDDDEPTLKILRDYSTYLPANTHIRIGKRDRTLNARMNQAVNEFPADIYTFLPDDGFPLSQHWDTKFNELRELPAFAWCELKDPENATFICLSERWRKATGRGLPEYFPFWFADTWILEVYLLAFAKPIGIAQQLSMGGKRGTTQGMRELPFWFDFFARTRVERIGEAEKVAREWGLAVDVARDRKEPLKYLEECDRAQLGRIKDYERIFKADIGEPSEVYKQAKARADAWRA
jgi:hypothetical protein